MRRSTVVVFGTAIALAGYRHASDADLVSTVIANTA